MPPLEIEVRGADLSRFSVEVVAGKRIALRRTDVDFTEDRLTGGARGDLDGGGFRGARFEPP